MPYGVTLFGTGSLSPLMPSRTGFHTPYGVTLFGTLPLLAGS